MLTQRLRTLQPGKRGHARSQLPQSELASWLTGMPSPVAPGLGINGSYQPRNACCKEPQPRAPCCTDEFYEGGKGMKGFDWIFFCIMVPPLLLALEELYRTRKR